MFSFKILKTECLFTLYNHHLCWNFIIFQPEFTDIFVECLQINFNFSKCKTHSSFFLYQHAVENLPVIIIFLWFVVHSIIKSYKNPFNYTQTGIKKKSCIFYKQLKIRKLLIKIFKTSKIKMMIVKNINK